MISQRVRPVCWSVLSHSCLRSWERFVLVVMSGVSPRGGFLLLMYFSILDICSLLRIIFVWSSVSFSSSSFVRVLGSLGSWVRLGWGVCCGVWGSSGFCVVCGVSSMGVSCSSSPFRSCSSCSSVMSWFSLFLVSGSVVVNSFSGICSRRESGIVERGGESVSSWVLSGEGGFVFTLFFCFFGCFLPVEWMYRTGKF